MNVKEMTKEQEETLLLYATYSILYLNDTACFAIQQMANKVKYKDKESQKIYGALMKRCKHYLTTINKIVDKNVDYYCDYCTAMDDICNGAYCQFKMSLLDAYKKENLPDYDYLTEVELMRSMLELSVEAGGKIIKDIKSVIPQVAWLERYLLKDMERVADNFSKWAYRTIPKECGIYLGEQSDVMKKFRFLTTCLIDYYSFDKAYKNAVKLELERKNKK